MTNGALPSAWVFFSGVEVFKSQASQLAVVVTCQGGCCVPIRAARTQHSSHLPTLVAQAVFESHPATKQLCDPGASGA